ncbi:MAG: hypothetical protein WDA09_02250 [Bacteriovoracaceae bacterium]
MTNEAQLIQKEFNLLVDHKDPEFRRAVERAAKHLNEFSEIIKEVCTEDKQVFDYLATSIYKRSAQEEIVSSYLGVDKTLIITSPRRDRVLAMGIQCMLYEALAKIYTVARVSLAYSVRDTAVSWIMLNSEGKVLDIFIDLDYLMDNFEDYVKDAVEQMKRSRYTRAGFGDLFDQFLKPKKGDHDEE